MTLHIIAAMDAELTAWHKRHGTHDNINNLSGPKWTSTISGVGKVNGALALNDRLKKAIGCSGQICVIGTAAACDPLLEIGDVVIATNTLHHDVDVTALGFASGQIPFNERWVWQSNSDLQTRMVQACEKLSLRHTLGRIITGDQFIADPAKVANLHKTFGAAAIEMETAGVAQACDSQTLPIPWIGVRIISDLADKSAPVSFEEFLPKASETIANILDAFLEF